MNEPVINESHAREQTRCVGCNAPKQIGLVVCWACFKGGRYDNPHFVPLKYYGDTFENWQKEKWLTPRTTEGGQQP